MDYNSAKSIALGGVLAALAVLFMSLGGMIPMATYICPMLCILLLKTVLNICGKKIAWAWYGAVMLLSLMLSPDKEGALVFVVLGYYPILKPALDRRRVPFLWKLMLFQCSILILYGVLTKVFGLDQVMEEFQSLGIVMGIVTLVLGNAVFFLLDILLGKFPIKRLRK